MLLLVPFGIAGWGAGFAWFVHASRQEPPPLSVADGIVALTGGAERVARALQLLEDGRAPLLLISGVGHNTEIAALLPSNPPSGTHTEPDALARRVTLGRTAATTAGNAAETAAWASSHAMHSLLVVTAGYHMPRALLELQRSLPGVALTPVPVQPPAMRRRDPATWRLLAGEYNKFLAVRLGVAPILRRWASGLTTAAQGFKRVQQG